MYLFNSVNIFSPSQYWGKSPDVASVYHLMPGYAEIIRAAVTEHFYLPISTML